jgi:hypothetical protein
VRRAGDRRSLRPRGDRLEVPPTAAGANRASARAIEPSDFRIARTSLPTDVRRGLRKRASTADTTDESYYAVGEIPAKGLSRPTGLTTFEATAEK